MATWDSDDRLRVGQSAWSVSDARERALAAVTTLAGMEAAQFAGIARRKLRSEVFPRLGRSPAGDYEPTEVPKLDLDSLAANTRVLTEHVSPDTREYADRQTELLVDGTVSFLNRTVAADGVPFDVDPQAGQSQGYPLLWSLKLWSLAPVRWLVHGSGDATGVVARLLANWLGSWQGAGLTDLDSPGYLRTYWTPYAVSRRIDNLARLMALPSTGLSAAERDRLATHLAKNVRFLRDHVEYDVGGNHLIENGCALVVGGVALDDAATVDQGVEVLRTELPPQLREDGLHFEMSPMYHTILLYRVASALDLLDRADRDPPESLRRSVQAMHGWLASVAPAGASYPLLNDAAYHEGPSRETCLRTVSAVLGGDDQRAAEPLASGYHTLQTANLWALVDGGPPCPPHLPAHGHNDVGNVVAWVGNDPLLVDTGVYDYDAGDRRNYARSVAAHNTVQVGDAPQSPLTGKYMMGPRLDPSVTVEAHGTNRAVTVEYAAPKRWPKYEHRRTVTAGDGHLRVEDRVASSRGPATSRFHLDPSWTVDRVQSDEDATVFRFTRPDGPGVLFAVSGADDTAIIDTEYYPEYGRIERQKTMAVRFEPAADLERDPVRQTFTVER